MVNQGCIDDKKGAGVTTRAHVRYVTEYGMVDLFGKNLKQRCELMISIAHPDVGSIYI